MSLAAVAAAAAGAARRRQQRLSGPGAQGVSWVYQPGSLALATSASSVRTYIDDAGVMQLAASGVARDADYSTGQRGLLVESQRTNVIENGHFAVNLGNWTISGAPVRIADDGVFGATCVEVPASGTNFIRRTRAPEGAWVGGDVVSLSAWGNGTDTFRVGNTASAELDGPLLTFTGGTGGLWQRQVRAIPLVADGNTDMLVASTPGAAAARATCIQLEKGAFPTSYIPTAGAAATRTADAVRATGVLPAGIHATRYEHYFDLATGAEVEQVVDVPSTGTDAVFADADAGVIDRVWYAMAVADGVRTLGEMQALVAEYALENLAATLAAEGASAVFAYLAEDATVDGSANVIGWPEHRGSGADLALQGAVDGLLTQDLAHVLGPRINVNASNTGLAYQGAALDAVVEGVAVVFVMTEPVDTFVDNVLADMSEGTGQPTHMQVFVRPDEGPEVASSDPIADPIALGFGTYADGARHVFQWARTLDSGAGERTFGVRVDGGAPTVTTSAGATARTTPANRLDLLQHRSGNTRRAKVSQLSAVLYLALPVDVEYSDAMSAAVVDWARAHRGVATP